MPKVVLSLAALIVAFSLPPAVFGEDFAFDRSRPLFALTSILQHRYGLLVTYEDGPADPATELRGELRPSGFTDFFPIWRPITFRVPPYLPNRDNTLAPIATDPIQSLAAVQELVRQYNESGNPGRFSVVQDGSYLHIQQTKRKVGGTLQAFEPITNTVVSLDRTRRSCNAVLMDLFAQLHQVRGVNMAQGAIDPNNLFLHKCSVGEGPLTARQVLAGLVDEFGRNNLSGQKVRSKSWELVYTPNGDRYFLSISLVNYPDPPPQAYPPRPVPDSPELPGGRRSDRIFRAPTPKN